MLTSEGFEYCPCCQQEIAVAHMNKRTVILPTLMKMEGTIGTTQFSTNIKTCRAFCCPNDDSILRITGVTYR